MSSHLQCSVYPGYEKAAEDWHISSAIRIPPNSSIIAIGGQTGGINWKFGTLEEQFAIVFEKLDKALCAAVPEMTSEQVWKHVYYINSYHVGWSVEQGMLMSKTLKKYMGDHRPAGTGVGVKNLAYPECLLEVALYAAVPN